MDDQTLIFVEAGGVTIADEWIECRQLSTREVQTSLLRRRRSAWCRMLSRTQWKDQAGYAVIECQLHRGPGDVQSFIDQRHC